MTRTRLRKREFVETPLTVTAILNPRADGLPRIYAPLQFVTDVELYREGQAVPERKWAGSHPHPFLSFDGVFVVLSTPLSRIQTRKLTINTGLAEITDITAEQFKQAMGFSLPADHTAYKLVARGNTIQIDSIKRIKNKLRGQSAIILPFVDDASITINQQDTNDQSRRFIPLALKNRTTGPTYATLESFRRRSLVCKTSPNPLTHSFPIDKTLASQYQYFRKHNQLPAQIGRSNRGRLRDCAKRTHRHLKNRQSTAYFI